MAKLTKAIPIIPVADMAASRDFYLERLGFQVSFEHDGYCGVQRDGIEIHLCHIADEKLARDTGSQTMLRFETDDVETLFEEYRVHEGVIHPNGNLAQKPWGTCEFGVLDPCGVCISFMQAE